MKSDCIGNGQMEYPSGRDRNAAVTAITPYVKFPSQTPKWALHLSGSAVSVAVFEHD
jgi:hypothetical protein